MEKSRRHVNNKTAKSALVESKKDLCAGKEDGVAGEAQLLNTI
jgi:hypothetical protein